MTTLGEGFPVRGSPIGNAAGVASTLADIESYSKVRQVEVKRVSRSLRLLLAGLLSGVAVISMSTSNAALASQPTVDRSEAPSLRFEEACQGKADRPHYSNGAGGIIFKMRATCRVTRKIDSASGRLWKCPNPPSGDEGSWTGQGCTLPTYHNYVDQTVQAGTTGTWYVPPAGQPGVHGAGHWVGVAFFSANGSTTKVRSEAVYIDR